MKKEKRIPHAYVVFSGVILLAICHRPKRHGIAARGRRRRSVTRSRGAAVRQKKKTTSLENRHRTRKTLSFPERKSRRFFTFYFSVYSGFLNDRRRRLNALNFKKKYSETNVRRDFRVVNRT